jgi:hypothetical protein
LAKGHIQHSQGHRREVWFGSPQRILMDSAVPDNMHAELLVYRDYGDYRPF